jgi:chromosome partitioning protein
MKIPKKTRTEKVTFSFLSPQAESVSIAGDFNDWNPVRHPLRKDKKGVWKVSLDLAPRTYQYRLLVDGQWQNDPGCADVVENPFGSLNCVRRVE